MIRQSLLQFFEHWPAESGPALKTILANKAFNKNLKKGLIPGKSFPEDKRIFPLNSLKSKPILCDELPKLLENKAGIPSNRYKIKGSIGSGQPAEVPWICIFDTDITTSAKNGFYIVFLLKSDMSGMYLSLNQGWTQYEEEFGIKEGRKVVLRNSNLAREIIKGAEGFSFDPIDLKAQWDLAKGYELTNICSKYYSASDLPEDPELVHDLRNLMGVYRELKGAIGFDILAIGNSLEEEHFQEEAQKGKRVELPNGPIPKKARKEKTSTSSSSSRDPNMSYTAIEKAGYQCENDVEHETFISAKTNHPFVEAHHLIPMQYQDDFEHSIDVPENIISLCPNCHRAFHHAEDELMKKLVKKFYAQRAPILEQGRNIHIKEEDLVDYYSNGNYA